MNPKVSIITVVYNNVDTIGPCIESVLGQNYANIEYIVIDGASTDGTQEIIERYVEQIDVYISEPDAGIYDAMNKGLALASGDIVAFLNSDDRYFSDAVSLSVKNLKENDCDLSYAGFYYANEDGYVIIADEARPWNESLLVQGIPGGHETIFAKRSCYASIGLYDLTYRLAADYHWVMRAFDAGLKGCGMAKTILVMAPGGASYNEALELSENRRLLEDRFGALSDDLFDKLYNLKFYRNWHGCAFDDRQMIEIIDMAKAHNPELARAVTKVIENRKAPLVGNIRANCDNSNDGKRILIVLTFLSGVNGGAERIAIEQANELHARGYHVTILSCSAMAAQPFYPLHPDIPYIDLAIDPYKKYYERHHPNLYADYRDWKEFHFHELDYTPTEEDFQNWLNSGHLWRARMYAAFLLENKFDIVLAHMPSSYPYVLLLDKYVREKQPNLRIIASLHNAPSFKFYNSDYPADSSMDRFMRLATLHHADRIGLLFEAFREQMPDTLQNKCIVIPNFTMHRPKDIEPKHRKKRILSVGRLAVQKDHATLLRAYRKLQDSHPEWDLQIYGDGPLRSELEALAVDLELDPSKIFQGSCSNIAERYEEASIFAFPSRFEGFGLVIIEAMAAGLPVIGFADCEGVKNVIQHEQSGILIEGENRAQEMFEAIQHLVVSPHERSKLSKNALARVDDFSLHNAIDALETQFSIVTLDCRTQQTSNKLPVSPQSPPLKTLILTAYTTGGAGIAAMRLHNAMKAAGHISKVLTFSPSQDEHTYTTYLTPEEYSIEKSQHPLYSLQNRKPLSTLFSPGVSGFSERHFAFFEQFDVINIHWVANMLRYDLVERLAELGKPIVWTLHDMNPFTGGCHYSDGCEGYKSNCRNCPQLIDSFGDFPETIRAMKGGSWPKHMTIVSPSRWLAQEAVCSTAFQGCRSVTIANSLDLNTFSPIDKSEARSSFGLPQDKKILLFSSLNNNERRKGFPELIDTAKLLAERGHDFHIVALGEPNEAITELSLGYTAVGFLSEPRDIAKLISAADVTVLPTLEDNLPNVILESVACGTPVAAFAAGGVPEAVIPGVSGALAPPGDIGSLANAIERLFQADLSTHCRRMAEIRFSPTEQATAYEGLFRKLIAHPPAQSEPRLASAQFNIMERKLELQARSLVIADQDITYLKNMCDDFRTEIAGLRAPSRPDAPAPEPELERDLHNSVSVVEERFFGEDGFVNLHMPYDAAAPALPSGFYAKLWLRSEGVFLELREKDGAFAILPNEHVEMAQDEYGRVAYMKLLEPDLSDGPDLSYLRRDTYRIMIGLSAAISKAELLRRDDWMNIAAHLGRKFSDFA